MQFIPYFQTTRYRVQAMVDLAEVKPEDKHADLGAGDGRIMLAFAQTGIDSCGFELDPTLISIAENTFQKMKQTEHTVMYQKDFWQENLSSFSIITVYGMPDVMEALEKKLLAELMPGSRVLLNYYPFPTWQLEKTKDNIYLYKKN